MMSLRVRQIEHFRRIHPPLSTGAGSATMETDEVARKNLDSRWVRVRPFRRSAA